MPSVSSLKGTKSNSTITLSKRVLAVQPSVTLAIAAKAKAMKAAGQDVVSLSAGEPDFDTPQYIKDAAIQALQKGATKYTPVSGTPEIRKSIAAKLERDQNLKFSLDQILVTTGAKHAIFNILFALLNPGDEVIIPSPYWLSYPEMVTVLGGTSIFIDTNESTSFKITPAFLKKAISPKSKVLILNSPSNPTGAVYSKEELQALIEVLKKYPQILILSDEIYEKLIFDGQKHYSIASLDPDIAKRTVIINGMSKAYAMTGWRLGYAACPDADLAKAAESIQSHSTSNPNSFSQAGGAVALDQGEKDASLMRESFEKRRTFFYNLIKELPGFVPFMPQGAFYLFANIEGTGRKSLELSNALLDEALVAVVPGKPFGSDNHIRMSFASSEKSLEEAAKRMMAWLKKNR